MTESGESDLTVGRAPAQWSSRPTKLATTRCVVVSGLPASGKSTLGAQLANALGWRALDKDSYLETLFETRGCQTLAERQALSRESDLRFISEARLTPAAILISHWRAPGVTGESGTPTEWLQDAFNTVVELHCACAPSIAAARFHARQRHPGHQDARRDQSETLAWFLDYADTLPLGIGRCVRVPMDPYPPLKPIVTRVNDLLDVPTE